MPIDIIERPSPNHNSRNGTKIDCIVIHDTESRTAEAALSWFESPESKVSAHYVIDRDGTVYRCVQDDARAWHAGVSELEGRPDVNTFSLGVELVGFAGESYEDVQIDVTVGLCVDLCARFPAITVDRIVGHDQVARPVGRKNDPGQLFPWATVRVRIEADLNASLV
jgi:N-acetylmuramoyl-L-alanine amidase